MPDRSRTARHPDREPIGVWCSVSTQSAPVGIRTPNLLIRSQMLYPLSYGCVVPSLGGTKSHLSASGPHPRNRSPEGRRHRRPDGRTRHTPSRVTAVSDRSTDLRMSTESPARNRQAAVVFLAVPRRCEPSHRSPPCLQPKGLPAARTLKSSRHLFSMWTPAARSGLVQDPPVEQLHTGTTWCRAAPRAKGWAPS